MAEDAKKTVEELAEADREQAAALRAAEVEGAGRTSVIAAADARLDELDGTPPTEDGEERRRDPSGRILYPWETDSPAKDSSKA